MATNFDVAAMYLRASRGNESVLSFFENLGNGKVFKEKKKIRSSPQRGTPYADDRGPLYLVRESPRTLCRGTFRIVTAIAVNNHSENLMNECTSFCILSTKLIFFKP